MMIQHQGAFLFLSRRVLFLAKAQFEYEYIKFSIMTKGREGWGTPAVSHRGQSTQRTQPGNLVSVNIIQFQKLCE